jgi:hypothetical protein
VRRVSLTLPANAETGAVRYVLRGGQLVLEK